MLDDFTFLLTQLGYGVDDIINIFSMMGYDADFETKTWHGYMTPFGEYIQAGTKGGLAAAEAGLKRVTMEFPSLKIATKKGVSEYNTGVGSGGGGGSSYSAPEPKTVSNDDRYHEVDKQLESQSDLISDIDTQIDRTYGTNKVGLFANKIDSLNHQLELQNQKLAAAENYLAMDLQAIHAQGLIPVIDQVTDQVLNYSQLVQQAINDFNAVVTKSGVTEAEANAAEELYNARIIKTK